MEADEYSQIFGEPEEDSDTKTPLNITVSTEFRSLLQKMKEETGKSMSQIIEDKFVE